MFKRNLLVKFLIKNQVVNTAYKESCRVSNSDTPKNFTNSLEQPLRTIVWGGGLKVPKISVLPPDLVVRILKNIPWSFDREHFQFLLRNPRKSKFSVITRFRTRFTHFPYIFFPDRYFWVLRNSPIL